MMATAANPKCERSLVIIIAEDIMVQKVMNNTLQLALLINSPAFMLSYLNNIFNVASKLCS